MRNIAKVLGRSISTLSDELKRNSVQGSYDPQKANHKAYVRRKYSKYQGMNIVANTKLQEFVEKKLYNDQSPKNIAGRIKKHEKHLSSVSKNSIYRYIQSPYGRRIAYHRSQRKNRHSRKPRSSVKKIEGRIFINKRPQFINLRKRIGDAEADFIVSGKSGKGVLLIVADRKSRVPFLEKVLPVAIKNVHVAFLKIEKRFPEIKTITTDNDILFQHFKELEKLINVKIYFCHPYHSWEKGSIENINGYIRKDIPKGSNISKYSKKFIRSIENKLQGRIMEILDYHTPLELILKYRKQKKHRSAKKKNKK